MSIYEAMGHTIAVLKKQNQDLKDDYTEATEEIRRLMLVLECVLETHPDSEETCFQEIERAKSVLDNSHAGH